MEISMRDIKMNTLSLCRFNKGNKEHVNFLKEIISDETITKRFQGFLPNLLRNNHDDYYGFLNPYIKSRNK